MLVDAINRTLHTILIVSVLLHQDYLGITLLTPPAVLLSVAYRSHKEVTVNLYQLAGRTRRQSAGKPKATSYQTFSPLHNISGRVGARTHYSKE